MFQGLSRFSHLSIRGVLKDLDYSESEVEDCLKVILAFAYGNIQMMAEGFFDFLDPSLKQKVKEALFEIADYLGEVVLFEPNQKRWLKRIKLRRGNFLQVLK